jgi:hypothetical protein
MKIQEHDVETNEILLREATTKEKELLAKQEEFAKAHDEKIANKESTRQALILKLGLTEDEARVLFS